MTERNETYSRPAAHFEDDGTLAVRASAVKGCRPMLWYHATGQEATDPLSDEALTVMEAGTALEPVVLRAMERASWDVIPTDPQDPKPVSLWLYENLKVTGHPDATAVLPFFGGPEVIVEVKTRGPSAYRRWQTLGAERSHPESVAQLAVYTHAAYGGATMPDENGTERTRSDAPSADKSLFGDAADDTAAGTVEEEDSNDAVPDEQDTDEETPQDGQGSDDAEEQAGQPEDLKVVVSIKGGRATIGVQQPSSDPHIETFDDLDLSGLTREALAVVERARAKWEDEPKYPAHERPAPPARRRTRRDQGTAPAGTAEEGADQQQPETLRLF